MYHSFFGLTNDPFRMTPDPSVICLTERHKEALAGLGYAILNHKGFTVLTGDAGTGKTTLVSRIVQTVPREKVSFSVILNSVLTPSEFLESALMDFGLQEIPASKPQRVQYLQRFLLSEHQGGRQCVLIIDEAQNLSVEVLEEVRLLSNCELPDRKLLQIVLCGQSELDELLNQHALRQLKQRVEVRLRITPLTEQDVTEYIRFRWLAAGGHHPAPFQNDAVEAIGGYSNGIPRLINTICDHCLVSAFGEGAAQIERRHVEEAAGDLCLEWKPGAGSARPNVVEPTVAGQDSGAADPAKLPGLAVPPQAILATLARHEKQPGEGRSRVSRWVARFGLEKAGVL